MNHNCHKDKKLRYVLIVNTILRFLLIQSNLETLTLDLQDQQGNAVYEYAYL